MTRLDAMTTSTPQPRLAALLRRAFAPHAATAVVELRTAGWAAAAARPAVRAEAVAPQREQVLVAA